MEIKALPLNGLLEITPAIYRDNRGYFLECFNAERFRKAGIHETFVQDNQSFSVKGTVRGLHFQVEPFSQGKLVWVSSGKVLDVMIDLRKNSPDFGKKYHTILDGENFRMLYIPPGFAHGFSALEDSIFQYKTTEFYNKGAEHGINPFDSYLNIDWMVHQPVFSEKDAALPEFHELFSA